LYLKYKIDGISDKEKGSLLFPGRHTQVKCIALILVRPTNFYCFQEERMEMFVCGI
jgi:hypothetical protein